MFSLTRLIPGLILLLAFHLALATEEPDEFVVGAYLPDYRFYIDIQANLLYLTDLYLFSYAPPLGDCCLSEEEHWPKINEAVADNSTMVWLTVGGGGRSDFDAIDEPTPRFVRRLAQLLNRQAVRSKTRMGVVFDHEAVRDNKHLIKYYQFLRSSALRLQGNDIHVAVAVHAGQRFRNPSMDHVDYIHLMAYDMVNGQKFHASLDDIDRAVEILLEDWDADQILLGIPAYARHKEHPGSVKTFAEILDQGGSLETGDLEGFLYDTPVSVRTKVRWAREHGLGGVFLWELGQDKPGKNGVGILLQAMYEEAYPNSRASTTEAVDGADASSDEL